MKHPLNLYLLQRTERSLTQGGHDEAYGFVVRAASEYDARNLIISKPGLPRYGDEGSITWEDPKLSTCETLANNVGGKAEVILREFLHG